ncbi:MAG TPA: serine/threonine-protein kinase [Amnibacterium sp.]|nr:serine/threonine-protein kinase [Amnibacterium sp.]
MGGPPTAPLRTLQDRYRLTEVLGHGARATVYRAEDLVLGRDVAVKLIAVTAAEPGALREQEAEARRLASLTMHGLVTLLDAGVEIPADGPPRIFLVLELVEGTDLKRVLTRGALAPRQVAHIGLDVAEALQYMHDRGVVHRDVTPANVLLLDHGSERRPRVKLGDFGVQGIVGAAAADGAYRSPEQVAGRAAVPASDVYALGLVLLECLTGAVGPGAAAAAPPDPWRSTIARMLDPDPARRPDAAALAATFRRLVVEETGRHRGRAAHPGEDDRLAAVRAYGVLDTPPDAPFDRITHLASLVLDAPMAGIGILDADRVWFKSRSGPLPAEVPRAAALHAALLDGDGVVELADAVDAFAADPLVAAAPQVRFAAAAPLLTAEGVRVGLLGVYDTAPRILPPGAAETLADLAAIVLHELELRRAARRAALARR